MRVPAPLYLLTLVLMLAACGSESSDSFTTEDGSGEYTIDSESGEASMTIETPEGQVSMRSGSSVEVDLPDGFSLIGGAEVLTNTIVDQADGKGSLVTFRTDKTPAEVADFYRAQAEAAGIDLQLDATINDGRVLGGEGEGGVTFSMSANPDEEGGTLAQLVIGVGEDY